MSVGLPEYREPHGIKRHSRRKDIVSLTRPQVAGVVRLENERQLQDILADCGLRRTRNRRQTYRNKQGTVLMHIRDGSSYFDKKHEYDFIIHARDDVRNMVTYIRRQLQTEHAKLQKVHPQHDRGIRFKQPNKIYKSYE